MAKIKEGYVTELRDEVISRLRDRPVWLTFTEIERDTKIPESWLKELTKGTIADPGVCRIQTVKAYLDLRIQK